VTLTSNRSSWSEGRVVARFDFVIFSFNMSDTLSALKLFVRVARLGSFSRAGREFGLPQPSVSRIIRNLEREVGAALLTRTTRAVVLTEAGSEYLARAEPILNALDEANHVVRGTGELRGELRVGLAASFAVREIIPRLPTFIHRHPALRVDLILDDQRQDLVAEGVDIAVRFGALSDSTAVARRITAFPRILAASPDYLAKASRPNKPEDLRKHTLIVGPLGRGANWSFQKGRQVTSVRIDGRLSVTLAEGAVAAAVAGLGIVSTNIASCRKELTSGALIRLLANWDMGLMEVHAVMPAGRAAKPSARVFTEFLVAEFRGSWTESKTN
jgi:DNA-binding transcriptional LysR family regulator